VKTEETKKKEAVDIFFDVLRAMMRLEIGDNPTSMEEQEAVYIIKYIQGLVSKALEFWRDYQRLPLVEYTVYGDHRGGSNMFYYMSSDSNTVRQFMLRELTQHIEEAKAKWDTGLQARETKDPGLTMGEIKTNLAAYSAIAEHLKKSED